MQKKIKFRIFFSELFFFYSLVLFSLFYRSALLFLYNRSVLFFCGFAKTFVFSPLQGFTQRSPLVKIFWIYPKNQVIRKFSLRAICVIAKFWTSPQSSRLSSCVSFPTHGTPSHPLDTVHNHFLRQFTPF